MNELERLIDDRSADAELARLFRAGRAPAPIPRGAFQRSRRRVLGLVAAPLGLGVLGWVQHAALGAALGTTVAVVAALPRLLSPSPATPQAPPSASAPAPAPAPVRRVAAPLASADPGPPHAIAVPTASAPAAAFPLPTPENPLLRETRLLERARAELERRPELSLRLLAEHEREFPSGALAVEREFLAVAGLVQLGERARAEARATALRARNPGSLYEQRLERILGGGGAAP
jgi:hypothetical protein